MNVKSCENCKWWRREQTDDTMGTGMVCGNPGADDYGDWTRDIHGCKHWAAWDNRKCARCRWWEENEGDMVCMNGASENSAECTNPGHGCAEWEPMR